MVTCLKVIVTSGKGDLLVDLEDREDGDLEAANHELLEAIKVATAYRGHLKLLDDRIVKMAGLTVAKGSKEHYHSAQFGHDPEVQNMSRDALVALKVSETLIKNRMSRGQLDKGSILTFLRQFSLQSTSLRTICVEQASCTDVDLAIRTADGSCNNLDVASWGKAKTVYWREVPNAYDDRYQTPRTKGRDGFDLPSARRVSFTVSPDLDQPDRSCSLMLMQYGQFIDHDMTLAGATKPPNSQGISCCAPLYTDFPEFLHPECFAIVIPPDDPYYGQYGEYCMNFVRSAATARPHCYLGGREQINQITAYIDGSMIYGNSIGRQAQLRTFEGGQLKTTIINGRAFCPLNNDTRESEDCRVERTERKGCFFAGDNRANVVAHATALQTVFLREHNRIAATLSRMNGHWCDEVVFQQARRIVAAMIQQITYRDMLPMMVGSEYMAKYDLNLLTTGYSNYDSGQDPSIGNAFASAAYRFHSMIQGTCHMYNGKNQVSESRSLSSLLNNPEKLFEKGGLDQLVRNMVQQPMQNQDRYVTSEVTNHLFRTSDKGYGLDLLAIDVQRGRDHGLPGYPAYRQFCGLSEVRTWADMEMVMGPAHTGLLQDLYRSPDDVDLDIGGLLEPKLVGANVGETFACLIATTFRRVKFGDR
ncbi:Chorion peroxidase [Halotydeus destructor]|nr:Chorion peroxidase [Halotydeus destructor]